MDNSAEKKATAFKVSSCGHVATVTGEKMENRSILRMLIRHQDTAEQFVLF